MNASLEFPLYWIPLLPLLGAAVSLLLGRKLGRRAVHVLTCGAVLGALAVALVATFSKLYPIWRALHQSHGEEIPRLTSAVFEWISAGSVQIKLGLLLDPLSSVMVLVITFVGLLIHVYSTGYMAHDPDYARFFGYLNLFTAAMLLLVLGDNLVTLFVGWEGVGLCSYLLIGFWYDRSGTDQPGDANATAGRKAFIVNRVGDLAFILGLFLIFSVCGTLQIDELAGKTDQLMLIWSPLGIKVVSVAAVAAVLLLIGATGKSAQIPLYVWLPDAMAGPTPVSALIHAATMVTAGVYMIARLNFLFMLSPMVMGIVALVGAATALFAATIGFAQTDIKKVLAYSTISQLGYMFVGVGMGAYAAGVFHLFTHAFFKACLFLGAGSVIHAMSGKQDVREMGGLAKKLPLTHATFWVSCVAIAGIIPFAGFFSKDEILWRALSTANPAWPVWFPGLIYGLCLAAAAGTAFYMFRLYYLTFSGECRADSATRHHVHESPMAMTMPLLVLACGAAALGFLGLPGVSGLPNAFEAWLAPVLERGHHLAAAVSRIRPVGPNALSQSHGAELGLMLLSLAVAVGGILIARKLYKGGAQPAVARVTGRFPRLLRFVQNKYKIDELYDWTVVKPLSLFSRFLASVVDGFIIDLVGVNFLLGSVPDWVGRISRWLHSGNLQRYLVGMVGGLAAIVLLGSCPPDRFEVKLPGLQALVGVAVQLDASRLTDVDQRELEYRWSFGDGATSKESRPTVSHVYAKPGKYTVTLEVLDRRWQTRATASHPLEVVVPGAVKEQAPAPVPPEAGRPRPPRRVTGPRPPAGAPARGREVP